MDEIQLTLPTETAALLWKNELVGQISDGLWENSSTPTDWQDWYTAQVDVCEGQVGSHVPAHKYLRRGRSFRFVDLVIIVGERMIKLCQTIDPDYNEKKLRKDLNSCSAAVRTAYKRS